MSVPDPSATAPESATAPAERRLLLDNLPDNLASDGFVQYLAAEADRARADRDAARDDLDRERDAHRATRDRTYEYLEHGFDTLRLLAETSDQNAQLRRDLATERANRGWSTGDMAMAVSFGIAMAIFVAYCVIPLISMAVTR